jgi:hypothetical protein
VEAEKRSAFWKESLIGALFGGEHGEEPAWISGDPLQLVSVSN